MRADVVVVGMGPAGASTALRLARMGHQVVAVDRARFPRDKPCGEFLNPAGRALLSELGVHAEGTEIPAVRLHFGGEPIEVPLVDSEGVARPGLSVRRIGFDSALVQAAEAAGVEVRQGFCVRDIEGGTVVGEHERISAKVVVAADGSHSVIARKLGLVRPVPRLQRVAVVAHGEGLSVPRAVSMFPEDGDGVFGVMPQGEGGLVMSAVLPPTPGLDAMAFAHRRLDRAFGGLPTKLEVRTTACFGHRLTRLWTEGAVFVGDAARFVDPFTGEGMHHAIEGGLLAAEAVDAHLRLGRPLAAYASLRAELDRRYLVCDGVQTLVHCPPLVALARTLLGSRPRFARQVIATIADLLPAHALLSPRVLAALAIP